LPIYHGKCPEEILSGQYDPMKIIKIKMMAKKVQPVEFVQIISKVCTPTQKNDFALNWYPECDVNMTNFAIQNRAKLLKYMLHTKHRNPD